MAKIIAICGKICCGKTYYANQIKEKEVLSKENQRKQSLNKTLEYLESL